MKLDAKFLRPIDGRQLARYNPDKTISVPIVFGAPRFSDLGNRGQFVVKVKAPRGTWERWAAAWEENRPVPYKSVSRYLSRSRKADARELSSYAKADPQGFSSQLYAGGQEALFVHPERNPKPRGGSPHGVNPRIIERVRRESKHIYAWMQLWIADPPTTRPPEIRKVLDDSREKGRKTHAGYSAKAATLLIMNKREGIGVTDPESFYKHFIVSGGGLTAVYAHRDTLVRRALAGEKINWLMVQIPIREGSRLIDFLS